MITPIVESTTSPRNARIGYNNLLTATTTSGAEKMLIANTYERYKPSTGSITVKFQLDTLSPINFVGFAAHNFGTHDDGVDILVQYATTIGGALTTIDNASFSNNDAKMLTFDLVDAAEIAITFNATTSGLEIGIIYAGEYLEMQRSIYGGHSPAQTNAKTEYQSAVSTSGQFLGRTITSIGTETPFSWQHLSDDWVRDEFSLFMASARKLPFFMQWRPDLYDDSVFGFTVDDVTTSNMGGGHKLMTASFSMRGHDDL